MEGFEDPQSITFKKIVFHFNCLVNNLYFFKKKDLYQFIQALKVFTDDA